MRLKLPFANVSDPNHIITNITFFSTIIHSHHQSQPITWFILTAAPSLTCGLGLFSEVGCRNVQGLDWFHHLWLESEKQFLRVSAPTQEHRLQTDAINEAVFFLCCVSHSEATDSRKQPKIKPL